MSVVSLVKAKDYSDIKSKIKKSLDLLGGLSMFVKPGQTVLLKPNLFGPKANKNAVTNIDFLRAVAELVLEENAYPVIGELVANDELNINKEAFRELGIIRLALELKIQLSDFQTGKFRAIEVKNPLALKSVDVAERVLTADVVINLPKFKGHGCTFITGCVKNCFGCVRPKQRSQIHMKYPGEEFSKAIVDAFSAMNFSLNIMDAVIGMDGDEAPAYGTEAKIGYVIASADAVSADAVAARITGHNLNYIPTVKYAHEKKLGIGKLSEINIVGDNPEVIKFRHHCAYNNYVESKSKKTARKLCPEITESCTHCLTCMQNCPAKAIYEKDDALAIDYMKCAQCYRCLEVCPNEAIILKEHKIHL
jgi:uncharacterized protein (DUF362 family)